MDALAALRLQLEWGADDALDDHPCDRRLNEMPSCDVQNATVGRVVPLISVVPQAAQLAAQLAAQAQDVETLRASVMAFEACGLRATAGHTVFYEGDPRSKLVLIADAPDADDDRAGKAFAGASGDLLDRILQSVGLTRADVLISFLVPWRPPGNRPLAKLELEMCMPFLWRLLELVQPQHAMLLGGQAAKSVLKSEDTMRRLRGSWHNVALGETMLPALATHHPATLLATPGFKREAWTDWLMLRESLDRQS